MRHVWNVFQKKSDFTCEVQIQFLGVLKFFLNYDPKFKRGVYFSNLPKDYHFSCNGTPFSIRKESSHTVREVAGSDSRLILIPKKTEEITSELPLRLALRKISWSRSKCVWPFGDPKTTDFSFCGEPIEPGKPYCYKHCVLAYTNTRESS